jgi:hypothetical protein
MHEIVVGLLQMFQVRLLCALGLDHGGTPLGIGKRRIPGTH